MKKVDVLAIGVHPDDVELGCSGTLVKSVKQGMSVGICDLTQGELGTRGNAELRLKEAEEARQIIGASFRVNLGMEDGFFEVNKANKLKIVEVIRACRPDKVLINAPKDRHPDHGRSAQLEADACFLSGLRKIETEWEGESQEAWRPKLVLHYIQDYYMDPAVVVDISDEWDQKLQSIKAFSSQFFNANSSEPESPISSKQFLDVVEGRAMTYGRLIGTSYGEGYVAQRPVGVGSLGDLI